jgi:hypothetical protein
MFKADKLVSVVFLFLLFFSFDLAGQEKVKVSSDSAYVLIQNNTIVIADDDYTSELPFAILFPMFSKKRNYSTNLAQINLIGKIKKPQETRQIFLNDQNISFSEEGLFFKVLDVAPGKNVVRFKIVPKKGKSVIVNFFIQRTEEP